MFPKTKYFLDETLKTIYHAFQFTFYKFVTFVIFYLRNYILETLTKNNMKTKYVINMIQLRKSPFCLKNLIDYTNKYRLHKAIHHRYCSFKY